MNEVILDGQRLPLVRLIEEALSLEEGAVALAEIGRSARNLGLKSVLPASTPDVEVAPYALRSAIARLKGQWIAVDDDRLIGENESLAKLLADTEGRRATILFVPTDARRR